MELLFVRFKSVELFIEKDFLDGVVVWFVVVKWCIKVLEDWNGFGGIVVFIDKF